MIGQAISCLLLAWFCKLSAASATLPVWICCMLLYIHNLLYTPLLWQAVSCGSCFACLNQLHAGLGLRPFAHRSFAHLAHFAQIKWATGSDSLRLLKTNERLWANPSGRSEEMSNCESIAQVAQDKWVTVSNLLRSRKERMSVSLQKFWLKKSKILFFSMFFFI